jgi:hypothetical protein
MLENDIPIEELMDGLSAEEAAELDDEFGDPDDRDAAMPGISAVNWRALTDEESPATWAKLGDWVTWFLDRYEIPTAKIPTCWWRHGALVEELSALHTAWLVSFDSTDAGYGPIGWHERLTVAMQRITGWYHGQCAEQHQQRIGSRRAPINGDAEWLAWTRTSHA